MSDRPFRFGVVAGFAPTAQAWVAIACRTELLGYSTLLIPDTQGTLSPFPALAAAATTTTSLRVGTYTLDRPDLTPGTVAWESASLDLLSGGRFELGLGADRLGMQGDAPLGVELGTPGEGVQRLADTIRAVKELRGQPNDGASVRPVQQPHPPILVAASESPLLRLAAREADIIALGVPPQTPEKALATKVAELRHCAGARFDDVELTAHLAAVAGELEELPGTGRLARQVGGDPRVMAAIGGTGFLIGKPTQMADALRRRRDTLGISYITVSAMFIDQLAPVVEQLAGT